MSIEFHPMAMRDLLDAQIYYRDIDYNLGVDFRHQINETISLIQANPERFHFLSSRHTFAAPISRDFHSTLSMK